MKTRIVQNEPNDRTPTDQAVTQQDPGVGEADSAPPPILNGFRGFVRRYELVIFFALTYLIAWSTLPFGTFGAYAPIVSAVVVVLIAEGLPGLARIGRRLIQWRVNWIWYAAAIGLPLVVHAVAIGLNMAAGAPAPSGAQFQPWYAVLLLFGLRMVNFTDGPMGEEPAWRGFAQPRLQSKWSPLASAALLGATDHGLAHASGLYAAVRPWIPGYRLDGGSHILVRMAVQPDRRQCAAAAHRACHRRLC